MSLIPMPTGSTDTADIELLLLKDKTDDPSRVRFPYYSSTGKRDKKTIITDSPVALLALSYSFNCRSRNGI